MVAVHHEVAWLHFVRVHRAAGGLTAPAHVAAGSQGVLTEKFPICDQYQPPGGQLQTLQFSCAPRLERHGGPLLHQAIDGRLIGCIGHEAGDAVVLLQQGYGPRWLGREQPDAGLFALETLNQIGQSAEGIGVGRHRARGQIKAVGVLVALVQFGQVEAAPIAVHCRQQLRWGAVQPRLQRSCGHALGLAEFLHQF